MESSGNPLTKSLALLLAGWVALGVSWEDTRGEGMSTPKPGEFYGLFAKPSIKSPLIAQVETIRGLLDGFPGYKGLTIRTTWKEIEPQEGKLNWEGVDALVALTREKGMPVTFELFSGWYSPDWVYSRGVKAYETVDPNPNRSTYGDPRRSPIPWDPTFHRYWERTLTELAKHALSGKGDNKDNLQYREPPATGSRV